jgi:two-component system, OmpR family, copper resistance phosphate regulon response regulator CusR
MRALLRRGPGGDTPLRFADLTLDRSQHKASRGGREFQLTNKEFALLEFFIRRPGQILSRTVLAQHVWGVDFDSETNVIDVTVSHLRNKVDRSPAPQLIHTVRGAGYMLWLDKDGDT